MAYFGANSPDITPPTINITAPSEDVVMLDPGEVWELSFTEGTYTVRIEAIDHDRDEGSDEVQLDPGEVGIRVTGLQALLPLSWFAVPSARADRSTVGAQHGGGSVVVAAFSKGWSRSAGLRSFAARIPVDGAPRMPFQ